jgi:hypothetical protein
MIPPLVIMRGSGNIFGVVGLSATATPTNQNAGLLSDAIGEYHEHPT